MNGISQDVDESGQVGSAEPAESGASAAHRVRSVLAIRAFRRLWGVTYLCSVADWLALLALTGLVTKLTAGYQAQSFAFSGVVLTNLLPGLVFAPLGGLLADRFDRRKVMVVVDMIRCGLFLSIAVVGTWWWLFIANFLIGSTAMMWIPAKDSAIPNLLRRKDQVETAAQLGLVMTYGVAVVSAAGLYSLITGIGPNLHVWDSPLGVANVIVILNGLLYLTAGALVATRIPEISGRGHVREQPRQARTEGWWQMFRDGLRFAAHRPLTRGLMIGMVGAFAAGGVVVGTSNQYAKSLLGGDSTFGVLFVALFVGLGTGMAVAPGFARRMSHNRLFGMAIVLAGLALVLVALSPDLWVSLITVAAVGGCAGVAFLTGITIIGTQVEDSMRGRTNALYQSLMKAVPFVSIALAPLLVGVIQRHEVTLFGHPMTVDGTRPVLLGAGVLAALAGVVAYRQMGDRSTEPIVANLVSVLRGRPTRSSGLLVAVEGNTREDTEIQAGLLAEWLRLAGRHVQLAHDPALDDDRVSSLMAGLDLAGARARALVAAAMRADVVERQVRPALAAGNVVVIQRYVDSPLARLGPVGDLDPTELYGLADWATGPLRPDVTVLLDRDPATLTRPRPDSGRFGPVAHHWQVQRLLTEMAAADPDRYVVVDAEGSDDEVARRIRSALRPMLVARRVMPPTAGPDLASAQL